MKIQRIAAAIVLGASLFATGCAGDAAAGGGSKRDDGVGTSSAKVPSDARRVAEATGTRLIHRPLREGNVYVVDVDTNKVLFAGPVRANSNVVVDPAADAVTVNDQQVKVKTKLDSHHTYRLYFKQK